MFSMEESVLSEVNDTLFKFRCRSNITKVLIGCLTIIFLTVIGDKEEEGPSAERKSYRHFFTLCVLLINEFIK